MALLFDLKKDPAEMENLLEKADNKPIAKRLFNILQRLQEETGDELDLATVYPDLL